MGDINQTAAITNLKFYKRDGLNTCTMQFGFDVSSYSFNGAIVPKTGSIVQLTIDDSDAANGNIDFSASALSVAGLSTGKIGSWYMQWVDPDGEPLTIYTGSVEVLE